MSEWEKISLNELIKVKHGFAFPGESITSEITDRILVTPGNFRIGGGFKPDKFKYFDSNSYPIEYQFSGGELIVTMTDLSKETDTLGYSALVPADGKIYLHNQRVGLVQLKNERASKSFIYWLMRWKDYQEFIANSASGTSVMHTSPSRICEFEFNLPSLLEQKAIASVLFSLDDKIDLLHRQNKTLEAMAETLFRQWFIEEAKEDWEESDLTQLIQLQSGYAFKSKDFQEQGNFGVIKIKNISGSIVDIQQTDFVEDSVGLATAQRFYVKSGQVLIAMTGAEIGKLGLVPKTNKQLLLNQRVGLLVPKFKGAEYLAYLHLHSEFGQDYIENSATGSAQPNISGSLIEACPFPKCEDSFLKQCGEQVYIYYEKVKENLGQIQTLEKLRDTLLPKLMSGEVRVQFKQESAA